MSLLNNISVAWAAFAKVQKLDFSLDFETPEYKEATRQTEILADRFQPALEQYNDGLINAYELYCKLTEEALNN